MFEEVNHAVNWCAGSPWQPTGKGATGQQPRGRASEAVSGGNGLETDDTVQIC